MTYCKNYQLLFELVYNYLKNRGYFIFTHRIDIWEKLNFDDLLKLNENKFEIIYISKPLKYLPENKDFGNKVKIKIVLLSKKKEPRLSRLSFSFLLPSLYKSGPLLCFGKFPTLYDY